MPAKPFRLFFIWSAGCHYCGEMKPVIRAFRAAHPEGVVLEVAASRGAVAGWEPDGVPALLLIVGDRKFKQVGAMELDELEAWLKASLAKLSKKRKARPVDEDEDDSDSDSDSDDTEE